MIPILVGVMDRGGIFDLPVLDYKDCDVARIIAVCNVRKCDAQKNTKV